MGTRSPTENNMEKKSTNGVYPWDHYPGGGGGNSNIKKGGGARHHAYIRGVNFRFWSRLGC